jgi:hypothetical protein
MEKLALDQKTDFSGRELYQFLKGIEVPAFVKEASLDVAEDLEGLAPSAYGYPELEAYPINTPARTYVSYAHFVNKEAGLIDRYGKEKTAEIESRILKAAEVFGIEKTLAPLKARVILKTAAIEPRPVYIFQMGEDRVPFFHYKTAEDLSEHAQNFAREAKKFPFKNRKEICEAFVKAAEEVGLDDLPELILKYAGFAFGDAEQVAEELRRRQSILKESRFVPAELHEVYKSASTLGANGVVTLHDIYKLAEICDTLEAELKISNTARQRLGDPLDKMLTISVEKAAEELNCVCMGGRVYPISELVKIPKEVYQEAFGLDDDFDPKDEEALRAILPTMPKADVDFFDELVKRK